MATIDSSIAMGFKPIQIQDPLNRMASMMQIESGQNQNALAQYQLASAQRADEKVNFLNQRIAERTNKDTGAIDYPNLYKDVAQGGFGSYLPELIKQQQAGEKEANLIKKTKVETEGLTFKQKIDKQNKALAAIAALDTPAAALADINKHLAEGEIDQSQADALRASIAREPNFRNWQKSTLLSTLDGKDRLISEETARANAERERIAAEQLKVSKGNLSVSQQRLNAELSPVVQGELAAAKKRAEENVKFEVQGRIDVAANRKALKQAGYDPITGEDDITKLIKESTGGYLGKGLDIGARVFGSATEGSVALAQLEQKGNAITFGLLNGKLGAGISTSDRQFIEALVSRISDGTLPVEDRLAAWTSAKDMMRTLGMVEPPTKSGATKPSAAPAANTGSVPVPSLTDIFNPKPKTK
jgi:hypothetical protein